MNGGPDGLADGDVAFIPGQEYYVQIFYQGSSSFGTGELALQEFAPPPANDECANATPIMASSPSATLNYVPFSTLGASQSAESDN